jgi:hypothetical protein
LVLPGLVKLCSGKEIRMSLRGIGCFLWSCDGTYAETGGDRAETFKRNSIPFPGREDDPVAG